MARIYANGHSKDDVLVCATCRRTFNDSEMIEGRVTDPYLGEEPDFHKNPCGHSGHFRYSPDDWEKVKHCYQY